MKIRKLVSPFSLSLVTFVTSLALAGMTFAAPITYTFTGNGSGTVNGAPFTDADYTITVIGDTSAVTSPSPEHYFLLETTATMGITGVGTATVTDSVWVFDNQQTSGLGIGRNGPGDLLDVNNAAFATYALATSLGPISGLNASALHQFTNLASTLGPITLSSSGPVTFQAVLGSTWTGNVSIPWKITIVSKNAAGDSKFKKLSSSFTGTMEMYFGENGPQPNAEGCYVKFSGDDGSKICIKEIISISTDVKKSKTDQFLLIGTGTMTIVMEGTPLAGIAYLDSKETLKKVSGEISAITLSGKIGGGGGEGTDQAFVLGGNVKTNLTEQVD